MDSRQETALFVSAFFDELARWGVCETVISPGSRSTALAMTAFEMSERFPERMRVYVDVDERGASFFALGLAKASGRPVCLVCTSGTALANYYPAVMEAETSRVPLIVLSGDRPLRLQGFGAPQTVDQLKAYGTHVRAFRQMPLPGAAPHDIAFVRQAAREICLAAMGPGAAPVFHVKHSAEGGRETNSDDGIVVASRGCRYLAGPVQVNFQFDEPLTPDLSVEGAFTCGRGATCPAPSEQTRTVCLPSDAENSLTCPAPSGLAKPVASAGLPPADHAGLPPVGLAGLPSVAQVRRFVDDVSLARILDVLRGRRVLVLAGEGSCETAGEAREIVAWAQWVGMPLLADPLSGLRSFGDEVVIDNYDNVFGGDACPLPSVVVRFGRYPISKRCTQRLAAARPFNIVVDVAETRDFNMATDLFVPCTPLDFVRSFGRAGAGAALDEAPLCDASFLQEWVDLNARALVAIKAANMNDATAQPTGSAFDSASALDSENVSRETFSVVENGAMAAVSARSASAVRLAQQPAEGAFVHALLQLAPEGSCVFSANSMSVRTLDAAYTKSDKRLTVLCNRGQNGIDGTVSTALGAAQHYAQTTFLTGDFTMLHDLNALALQRELLLHHGGGAANSIVIVLLNNNGGGIFDMLPQKSEDAYFERLFVAPQDVRFADAARAFGVPYRAADTVAEFKDAYCAFLGTPGISLVEVSLPYAGTKERYAAYQAL